MTTVGVVDDDPIFRDGVGTWLAAHTEDVVVVGVADSVAALRTLLVEPPDVVVLDVVLGGSLLVDNLAALEGWGPLVVVASEDGRSPEMRRRALAGGARTFVGKTAGYAPLRTAIDHVVATGWYTPPELARFLYSEPARAALSTRQAEALRLYAGNLALADIAKRMGISKDTVKTYLRQIRERYRDLGRAASTRAELGARAQEDGYDGRW
ncbi:response regulator transcription factor [Saccharothrix violaceirubra]|uniref:DNA-binding NarL/FixJ family response regulator n=1 Tax=Saccharothrix violaceirubra TaxID=413306 RepID=A0A7W7T2H4_9PSEU|nr:response regulator [Saccharothrix violaceirubra]MBB4965301.1 DNA-binding NarL/FixJ family response regulator [Saccharothrix violaceirubra]